MSWKWDEKKRKRHCEKRLIFEITYKSIFASQEYTHQTEQFNLKPIQGPINAIGMFVFCKHLTMWKAKKKINDGTKEIVDDTRWCSFRAFCLGVRAPQTPSNSPEPNGILLSFYLLIVLCYYNRCSKWHFYWSNSNWNTCNWFEILYFYILQFKNKAIYSWARPIRLNTDEKYWWRRKKKHTILRTIIYFLFGYMSLSSSHPKCVLVWIWLQRLCLCDAVPKTWQTFTVNVYVESGKNTHTKQKKNKPHKRMGRRNVFGTKKKNNKSIAKGTLKNKCFCCRFYCEHVWL